MVGVEIEDREVQLVFPVRARELTLAVNNLGCHRSTATVSIAWVEHDAGICSLVLVLTLLDGHERQLVTALQPPGIDKVGVCTTGRVDISLVTACGIDSHRHCWQMSLRDDGCKRHPLLTLKGHELIELVQALARTLKGRCTFAKVFEVYLLELIRTLGT